MRFASIYGKEEWFQVLASDGRAQIASMRLDVGGMSGEEPGSHPDSDQVLLVVEGEIEAEIGRERRTLRQGDAVIVPAGTPHRFANRGSRAALTFNVYTPPAY